jgi:hypothetical protein
MGRRDLRDLLVRAHTQLGGPIVLIWDNLRMHLVEPLRESTADHSGWLSVFQPPSCSPNLNPQEGIWSSGTSAASRRLSAARSPAQSGRRLTRIQCRPDLVDGGLTGTDLITGV